MIGARGGRHESAAVELPGDRMLDRQGLEAALDTLRTHICSRVHEMVDRRLQYVFLLCTWAAGLRVGNFTFARLTYYFYGENTSRRSHGSDQSQTALDSARSAQASGLRSAHGSAWPRAASVAPSSVVSGGGRTY